MAGADALKRYKAKRNFAVTSEPAEGGTANEQARSFVVQKHWASRLHYDFRLELDGTMKSWAVPKGPSFDTHDKRMAVHVEDHPISYNSFEGEIPPKQYGAGKVIIWDKGVWMPLGNARKDYRDGKLKFELHGHKLRGRWTLVRMKGREERQEPWLLIKENDEFARPAAEFSVVDEMPNSVAALDLPAEAQPERRTEEAVVKPPARRNRRLPADWLPHDLAPQLAVLVDRPPADPEQWHYEIKFDGYRLLTRIEHGKIRLITRNGNDWTDRLKPLAAELRRMKLADGWYDGEIVVLDHKGLPDFQALQNAFDNSKTEQIVYFLFDLPYFDGEDLRAAPLEERRARLKAQLNGDSARIRFSEAFDVPVRDIVTSACRLGLEGVIGKLKGSRYASRRSKDWIKLKCSFRQEFVIGGYTDPQGSRSGIGSLLLGVHDAEGALQYAGNVGSGFDSRTLDELRRRLEALETGDNPFARKGRSADSAIPRKAHFVSPELVAEVSFGQWTKGGHIRHSVFHGLREDKPATAITREVSMPVPHGAHSARAARKSTTETSGQGSRHPRDDGHPGADESLLGKLKVTHPERVVDPTTGITKIDVIRHYALVGDLMMEHLKGRPVSLVRAPDGIKGQLFFQKHLETARMTGVRQLPPSLDPDHDPLMEIAAPQGLLSAAQMNVIEFHTWNGVKTAIGKPDRMTFDLDPGEGVNWPAMQEAALVMRAFLQELGLVSFVKTSGGKGLHVIVPIRRQHDWDTVKDFSHAIVDHLAATLPKRFSAKSGPKNRVGKIFIDYLRNGFGATTVAAWSARARPGMGVSVPVAWNEVEHLKSSDQWHIGNIHERLDTGNSPWTDYAKTRQGISTAMRILGFKPSSAR